MKVNGYPTLDKSNGSVKNNNSSFYHARLKQLETQKTILTLSKENALVKEKLINIETKFNELIKLLEKNNERN